MKRETCGLLLLLLAATTLVLTGCPKGGDAGNKTKTGGSAGSGTGETTFDGEILVGNYGSMTGKEATFGISTKNGIELAFEQVNAAGGVLGKKLVLKAEDDQGKPSEAKTAVTKLTKQDKVVAVIGEVASTRSLAGAPVCQSAKIPMISPSSTNEKVTEVGDYIFRVCFIDPFQGFVCAKFAAQSLKLKRAAVFEDLVSDYSKGLSRVFQENFKAMGGEIVAVESYQGAQTDFRAQLNAMKAKNPDVLFVPGYYSEVPSIAKQAREVGLKVPLIGGDGWEAEELLVNAGTALEGCYYSNHFHLDDPDETLQTFRRAYKEKYGKDPDSMAALGYDAAMVLVEAIKRCGSTEGPKLRDAIAATKEHRGTTGSITVNSKRNAEKPAVIVKIVGKEKRFAEKVAP